MYHSHNFKGWQTRVRYFYVRNVSPEFRDDSNWKRLLAFLLVDLRPSEGGTLESDPMTKVASPSSDTEPLGVPEGGILRATASGRGELSTSGAGYLTGDLSEVQRWIFFHAIVNFCHTLFSQATISPRINLQAGKVTYMKISIELQWLEIGLEVSCSWLPFEVIWTIFAKKVLFRVPFIEIPFVNGNFFPGPISFQDTGLLGSNGSIFPLATFWSLVRPF